MKPSIAQANTPSLRAMPLDRFGKCNDRAFRSRRNRPLLWQRPGSLENRPRAKLSSSSRKRVISAFRRLSRGTAETLFHEHQA